MVTGIGTIVAAGLAGAAAWIFWNQLGTMQAQLVEQRQEFWTDRRPWIAFDDTVPMNQTFVFDEKGGHVSIVATIKNGGKSLAKNIESLASPLIIGPIIPENTPINASEINRLEMRGLPGVEPCGPDIAKQFIGLGGSTLLAGGTQRWLPNGNGHFDIPSNHFTLDSRGRVSAWMDACIFYADEAGGVHGTPAVLTFVDESGSNNFIPSGEVHGEFRVFTGGAGAY